MVQNYENFVGDSTSVPKSAVMGTSASVPLWAGRVLKGAGIYNLVWCASVVLFPNLFFDLLSMARPNYPQIWQCVGMVVGVYGIGYWIAAQNPLTHWPIVLVGFLGKIFGPLGFLFSLLQGTLPIKFGALLITNDLLWWLPFYLILRAKWNATHPLKRGTL
jgi:hypothetical protein